MEEKESWAPTFSTREQASKAMRVLNFLISNEQQLIVLLKRFSEESDQCKNN